MAFDLSTLITDRTQDDYNRWKTLRAKSWQAMTASEKDEWLAGMSGAYNASDMNRVGAATAYVSAEAVGMINYITAYLADHGVADDAIFRPFTKSNAAVTPKTDWTVQDIPTPAQAEIYLNNVETLRRLLPWTYPTLPDDLDDLTPGEANNIEAILLAVIDALDAFLDLAKERIDYIGNYNYQLISGTFYAGNHRTLQHFSRGR